MPLYRAQKAQKRLSQPLSAPEWGSEKDIKEFFNSLLDFGDCAIYASALLAEADQLITTDRYFRDTASRVHNPGGAPPHQQAHFANVKRKMEALLATAIGIDASEVNLPEARKDW